jgi:hypothetical protein
MVLAKETIVGQQMYMFRNSVPKLKHGLINIKMHRYA